MVQSSLYEIILRKITKSPECLEALIRGTLSQFDLFLSQVVYSGICQPEGRLWGRALVPYDTVITV